MKNSDDSVMMSPPDYAWHALFKVRAGDQPVVYTPGLSKGPSTSDLRAASDRQLRPPRTRKLAPRRVLLRIERRSTSDTARALGPVAHHDRDYPRVHPKTGADVLTGTNGRGGIGRSDGEEPEECRALGCVAFPCRICKWGVRRWREALLASAGPAPAQLRSCYMSKVGDRWVVRRLRRIREA